MKKLYLLLASVLLLYAATASDTFARGGGGFSGGRSSFSSGRSSFSGGRSSFSSGRSSFGSGRSSSPTVSKPSTPSKPSSGGFFSSARGLFGRGSSTSKGSTFTKSSRGSGFASKPTAALPHTPKESLYESKATVSTPYRSMPIYHYYYPSPFYGSGYSFYQYYFWYHMFGNHSQCYHNGGGRALAPRKCDDKLKDKACYEGEFCDLKVHECKLKQQ